MPLYNLKLAWWNTALTPAARSSKSKANVETYSIICEHIKKFIIDLSCDLIAICEVCTEDIAHINAYLDSNLTNIKVLDLTYSIGRTRFDTAVIYNIVTAL